MNEERFGEVHGVGCCAHADPGRDELTVSLETAGQNFTEKVARYKGPGREFRGCRYRDNGQNLCGLIYGTGYTGGVFQFDASLPDGGEFYPSRDIPVGVRWTCFRSDARYLAEMPFDEYLADALARKLRMPVLAYEGIEHVVPAHEKMEESGTGGKVVVLVP